MIVSSDSDAPDLLREDKFQIATIGGLILREEVGAET